MIFVKQTHKRMTVPKLILLNHNVENHCHGAWNTCQLVLPFSPLQQNLLAARSSGYALFIIVRPASRVMFVTLKVFEKCIVNE